MHRKEPYKRRADVASIILEAAEVGENETKLMQAAYISPPLLKDYVLMLQGNQLLEYDSKKDMYYTTERGKRFLGICQSLEGILPRFDDDLRTDDNKEK